MEAPIITLTLVGIMNATILLMPLLFSILLILLIFVDLNIGT